MNGDALLKIARQNPDVEVMDGAKMTRTDAAAAYAQAERDSLSRLFLAHWQRHELPTLTPEYRFHPERKWRFDYAMPSLLIAIEIDGGTRKMGRHNRADGYAKDAEKINAAQGLGWRVWRFSDVMLGEGRDAMDGYLQPLIETLQSAGDVVK